jgi:hypothetical protein
MFAVGGPQVLGPVVNRAKMSDADQGVIIIMPCGRLAKRCQGSDSQLDPIECTDEGCGGKEVSGEFVVARGGTLPRRVR